MSANIVHSDCLAAMRDMEASTFDAVVTDPPAGISFMGKEWDSFGGRGNKNAEKDQQAGKGLGPRNARNPNGKDTQPFGYSGSTLGTPKQRALFIAFLTDVMIECLRVAKPGAYALVWAIPRTSHWTGTAIEDAGWQVIDVVTHLFGSGFPKHVSKLKPAAEFWWLVWKPARHATPLQIERCRIGHSDDLSRYERSATSGFKNGGVYGGGGPCLTPAHPTGRYPANVVLSPEAARLLDEQAGERKSSGGKKLHRVDSPVYAGGYASCGSGNIGGLGDTGGPSRYFYCPKASRKDRGEGNGHPCVKPHNLMRWLVRLVTPPGGTILDPFTGSGSTGLAAIAEGFSFTGIEQSLEYVRIARRRLAACRAERRAA